VNDAGTVRKAKIPGSIRLRWRVAVAALAIMLLCILGSLWLPLVGSSLVFESSLPEQVDAAVILSGSIPDRALEAADLVRSGIAKSVLIVNDPIQESLLELRRLGVPVYTQSELNRFILLRRDVPKEQIQILPQLSGSTWEDAVALRSYLEAKPLDSVAVVTCRYHTYRSWLNFKRALDGLAVDLYIVPASQCLFDEQEWWRSRVSSWRVLQEWLKLGGYFLGYR